MKKEILCAALLLLFIMGCVQQPKVITVKKIIDCEKPKTEAEHQACSLVVENPNLKQCLNFENIADSFFCMALITKDHKICDKINGSKYYLCRAYIDNNPLICDEIKINSEKDLCYADLGMNLRSEALCNKVVGESKKSVCFAVINFDIEKCFVDQELKSICVTNIIEFSEGKVSCDHLVGEKRLECLNVLGGS
ncbi:MAG: hypothetical protein QW404_00635 [Candidatus Nanoarchaeia archaeon]